MNKEKILSFIPTWLLMTLFGIIFLLFWPVILIYWGIKSLFSKKSSDSVKITGAKVAILTIIGIVGFLIFIKYEYPISIFGNLLMKSVVIIMLIGAIVFAILQKFFPKTKWLNGNIETKSENNSDVYEFINQAGNKEIYTLGYKDAGKFDIYWDDIIASKKNQKDIVTADGTGILSSFSPEEALSFINKTCPSCGGSVDRFFFIDNFEDKDGEWGDAGWMEVCFKCKKLIYLDTDVMD